MTASPQSGAVVAVIPARGGSKGIPEKNLAKVGGISLIGRAVSACRQCEQITEVVVSTDHEAIAEEARRFGALVIARPPELSGDLASSESAVLHALDGRRLAGFTDPAVTVLVQCTSPFIDPSDLTRLVVTAAGPAADSAFLGAATHQFQWELSDGESAAPIGHDPTRRIRRQDLAPRYIETGAAYAFKTDRFRQDGTRFCGTTTVVASDSELSIEIDSPHDLELARYLARTAGPSSAVDERLNDIEALVFDFDGVFTDDGVLTLTDGTEAVMCSRGDGMGIARLRELTDLRLLVLSTEVNPVVASRCAKLKIEVLHGLDDKRLALRSWLDDAAIPPEACAFVGNDVNDLGCMDLAGLSFAPADAGQPVLDVVDVVLKRRGGHGAVRELAEMFIARSHGATT